MFSDDAISVSATDTTFPFSSHMTCKRTHNKLISVSDRSGASRIHVLLMYERRIALRCTWRHKNRTKSLWTKGIERKSFCGFGDVKVERPHRTDQAEFYKLLSYPDDVDPNSKIDAWENFHHRDFLSAKEIDPVVMRSMEGFPGEAPEPGSEKSK